MDRRMLQAKMLSELHPYFKRMSDYRVRLTHMSVAGIGSWEHNHDYNEVLEEENSTWTQAGRLAMVSHVQYRSF